MPQISFRAIDNAGKQYDLVLTFESAKMANIQSRCGNPVNFRADGRYEMILPDGTTIDLASDDPQAP